MQAKATGQLPKALDGIEFRAIRGQKVKLKALVAILSPGAVQVRVMISDVVDDERDGATAFGGDGPPLFQEGMEGHGVEALGFPPEYELAVAQADRPEVSHASTAWIVQQDGLAIFGRDPHPTARSILLKVDLIGRPQIHVSVGGQLQEFFYMPAVAADRREQSWAVACAAESQTCGKFFGTAGPPTGCGTERE